MARPPPMKHDFIVEKHASFLKVGPIKRQQASIATKSSSNLTSKRPSAIMVRNTISTTKQESTDMSDQFENSLHLLKEEKNTPMCAEAYPQRLTVFQNSFDVDYSDNGSASAISRSNIYDKDGARSRHRASRQSRQARKKKR